MLDDSLIRDFAYKLHRMLCGASQILGLYLIATPENLTKYKASYETILKALLLDRTTTAISSTTFFVFTVALSTGGLSALRCTFTEKNSSPVTDSVQFRIAGTKASELVRVSTTWKLDLLLPVKRSIAGEHEQRFHKTLLKVLSDECNKIESSVVVDLGDETIVEDDEEELSSSLGEVCLKIPANVSKLAELEAEIEAALNKASDSTKKKTKKSGSAAQARMQAEAEGEASRKERQFAMFSRPMAPSEVNSFAVHQVASGALRLRGSMVGVSWLPAVEAEGAKMARFLRLDLMRSLQSRVGHLFDDIATRKQAMDAGEDDADRTSLGRAATFQAALPRRVLVSSVLQQATLCDYLRPRESLVECKERLKATLGLHEVQLEVLEGGVVHEGETWSAAELSDLPTDSKSLPTRTAHASSTTSLPSPPGHTSSWISRPVLAAVLIALLAIILALLVFDPSSPKNAHSRSVRSS